MVDRLERELEDRVKVVRVNVLDSVGRAIASRYGMQSLPTFIVIDGSGQVQYRQSGLPKVSAILKAAAPDMEQ